MQTSLRMLCSVFALAILGLFAAFVIAPSAALAKAPRDQKVAPPAETDEEDDTRSYDSELQYVLLECSNGDVVLEVHPGWAPIGAAHFIKLVEEGFYDGAPWFRVIDGFMAQCGFSGDEELTAQWQDVRIKDDAVMQGNKRGYVSYGMTGEPNSRSTHFFINYGDNSFLDASGFAAFAVVVEGMEVADGFFKTGENPPDGQARLSGPGGLAWFGKQYPEASYIIRASITDDYDEDDEDDEDDDDDDDDDEDDEDEEDEEEEDA